MAGLVKAPLVTDTMPPTRARDGRWLAGLRTTLEQPEPGVLVWQTPNGRSYITAPTEYAV